MKIAKFMEGITDFLINLPEEMTTEIMERLPIRSIRRCNCVCKSWRDLVKRGEFGAKQEEMRAKSVEIQTLNNKIEELETLWISKDIASRASCERLGMNKNWMPRDFGILQDVTDKDLEIIQSLKSKYGEVLIINDCLIQRLKVSIEKLEIRLFEDQLK